MSHGSRICPSCGKLNGASEARCFYCNSRLPGPALSAVLDLWNSALGTDFPMTKLFVGMNLVIFGLCVAMDQDLPLFSGGFRPATLLRFGALGRHLWYDGFPELEPWRHLSAMFVHASLLHIGFNLLALTDLGRALEKTLGSARFTVVYLGSGILGFVVSDYWSRFGVPPGGLAPLFTVGASGGVFGLLGAMIGLLYARRDPAWKQALVRNAIFAAIIALSFPVNTPAHLGGAVVGALLGFLFEKERRPARLAWLMRVLAFVGVIASIGSVVLSSTSTVWKEQRQRALDRE